MNLYNQVKILFEISDIARNIFMGLKHSLQYGDNKVELYIYNSIHELEFDFKDMLNKYSESICEVDIKSKVVQLKNGTRVYLKTINEFIKRNDGYRFARIKFR